MYSSIKDSFLKISFLSIQFQHLLIFYAFLLLLLLTFSEFFEYILKKVDLDFLNFDTDLSQIY